MKVKHLLHCHLVVPADRLRALAAVQPLPTLKKLLNWSLPPVISKTGIREWHCQQFEVAPQRDYPTASLAALGADLGPGRDYWLHADPVYVHLLRDRIILTDETFADLGSDDAQAIVTTLNRHFAGQEMAFLAVGKHWYLRLQSSPDIGTSPREAALNADIQQHLPTGPDARRWHQCLNEIQMLLHDHPVNQAREHRGALPINSLWLSGGGVLPPVQAKPFAEIWTSDALLAGLAAASACSRFPAPVAAESWLEQAHAEGAVLLVPEPGGDFEQDWFAPLANALKAGRLQSLVLHVTTPGQVQSLVIPRTQCWKFWRRANPLDFAIHD